MGNSGIIKRIISEFFIGIMILFFAIFVPACDSTNPISFFATKTPTSTPSPTATLTFTSTITPSPTITPTHTPSNSPTPFLDIELDENGFVILHDTPDQTEISFYRYVEFLTVFEPIYSIYQSSILVAYSSELLDGPLEIYLDSILLDPYPEDVIDLTERLKNCIPPWHGKLIEFGRLDEKNYSADCVVVDSIDKLDREKWPGAHCSDIFISMYSDTLIDDAFFEYYNEGLDTPGILFTQSTTSESCSFIEQATLAGYGYSVELGLEEAIHFYINLIGNSAVLEDQKDSELYCSNFDLGSDDFLINAKHLGYWDLVNEIEEKVP